MGIEFVKPDSVLIYSVVFFRGCLKAAVTIFLCMPKHIAYLTQYVLSQDLIVASYCGRYIRKWIFDLFVACFRRMLLRQLQETIQVSETVR